MTKMLSRKYYKLIAKEFKNVRGLSKDNHQYSFDLIEKVLKALSAGLAYEFKQDNPSFDQHKFYLACGFED